MHTLLLTVLILYWPSAWRSHGVRVAEVVRAIEAATSLPSERAALAAVSLHETSLGARGVPFGCVGCLRRRTAHEAAPGALRALREGLSRCRGWPGAFAWYHTGRCQVGAYERSERRAHARILGAIGTLRERPW